MGRRHRCYYRNSASSTCLRMGAAAGLLKDCWCEDKDIARLLKVAAAFNWI